MANVQAAFELFSSIGVIKAITHASVTFDRDCGEWVVNATIRNADGVGKKAAKLASFATAAEAVEFKRLAGF